MLRAMTSLSQQVVLVTGCSSGIGRALVRELSAQGHRPFASARRAEHVAELERDGIEAVRLDVNEPASVAQALQDIVARAGRIDVLINNAGVNAFGPVLELPLEQLRGIFETNVVGAIAVTQAVFPYMAERRAGRIINIGSVVGVLPTPFAGAYCASKSALHMLSEVMRMEVAPFGIDVVIVQPGGVQSSFSDNSARDIDRYREGSRYSPAFEGLRKRAYASQDNAMPTGDFAREVVASALATPAPRLIRLGTGAEHLPKLAEMPGEQRDALLAGNYGLDVLRGEGSASRSR